MADEYESAGQTVAVPDDYSWPKLVKLDGDALEVQYRHTLEELGKQGGMLGTIFRKTQKDTRPSQAGAPDQNDRERSLIDSAGGFKR